MAKINYSQGMTFLEVMIALAILALSLVALLQSQGASLNLGAKANAIDTATLLGQMKMEELQMELRKEGFDKLRDEDRGEFDREKFPKYSWEYKISKVKLPFASSQSGEEEQMKMVQSFMEKAIRQLDLTVNWQELNRKRSLSLTTHLVNFGYLPGVAATIPTIPGAAKWLTREHKIES